MAFSWYSTNEFSINFEVLITYFKTITNENEIIGLRNRFSYSSSNIKNLRSMAKKLLPSNTIYFQSWSVQFYSTQIFFILACKILHALECSDTTEIMYVYPKFNARNDGK